jgi:hypothetical protein
MKSNFTRPDWVPHVESDNRTLITGTTGGCIVLTGTESATYRRQCSFVPLRYREARH